MPLVIPDGYGEATCTWSVTGRSNPISVTMGYQAAGGLQTPTENAQAIYDSLATPNGFCDPDRMWDVFTFTGVTVHENVSGTIVGGASAGAVPGGMPVGANSPMVISSSFVVGKRSPFVGRHYQGRMYVPYMAFGENAIDYLGNILASTVGVAQTAAGLLLTGMVAGNVPMYLLHYAVAVGPAIPPTEVTSLVVSGKVGTQRRRIR